MSDFFEMFGGVFLIVIGVALLVFGLAFGQMQFIQKPGCTEYGELTGLQTHFSFGTGCLVKYEGRWVDYDVAAGNKHEVSIKK